MPQDLSLDLKVARRKAGLTQADCAHLMGLHRSMPCEWERGNHTPNLYQACLLVLILDINVEHLTNAYWEEAKADLATRLETLPAPKKHWVNTYNRQHTLDRIAEQLENLNRAHDSAA